MSDYVIQVGPVLSNFTGTGNTVLNLAAETTNVSSFIAPDPSVDSFVNVPFDVISTGGYFSTVQITDTFTYTYTPAAAAAVAATPEPGSVALLGTGLLAGAGAWRRRLRA